MNGSTIAMSLRRASPSTACAQASSVDTVAASCGSMRSSILPPCQPAASMPDGEQPVNRSSTSKTVPARPPRFMEPITTLPSSAPSSSRSSSTSAVPSTPSTPGLPSATTRRRSSSARSPIAVGCAPTRSAPRAG
jgi:hypothetical protein